LVLIIYKINTVQNIYTLSNTPYRHPAKMALNTWQNLVLGSALMFMPVFDLPALFIDIIVC